MRSPFSIAIWPLSMGNFWLTILDALLLFVNAFFNYYVISQVRHDVSPSVLTRSLLTCSCRVTAPGLLAPPGSVRSAAARHSSAAAAAAAGRVLERLRCHNQAHGKLETSFLSLFFQPISQYHKAFMIETSFDPKHTHMGTLSRTGMLPFQTGKILTVYA